MPEGKKDDSKGSPEILSTEQNENGLSTELNTGAESIEPIIWYEDLTHDGNAERIEVDINEVYTTSDPDAEQIKVYSGIDDSLIWSGHASMVNAGENGYYIYKNTNNSKTYILQWHPYTINDESEYSYKVFSLSEEGKENVLKEEKIEFSFISPKEDDAINVGFYLEGVNELLAESYVLIDTNNYDLLYSEQDTPITREFGIENIIKEIYEAMELQEEHIVWYEDLTHDGVDERIEVDINHLNPNNGFIPYYEPQTVMVYSGQTDELIWSGYTDIVHMGWDGFYIYRNPADGQTYILKWKPYMSTGMADYNYRVFSLTETGEEIVIDESDYEFILDQPETDDAENVSVYLDHVNEMLRNSYVLIDTDNGEAFYSEEGEPVTKEFDTKGLIDEINYFLQQD